jgi:integrase
MKNPNGYGSISKLSGNRRRPFWVRITVGWDIKDGKQKQITQTLGYYSSRKEAMVALANYNANPYDVSATKSTFNDMWEIWSEKHFEKYPRSENAIKSAYKHCKPLYNVKMQDIKTNQMQAIIDAMSGMSIESQTKVKSIFKNCFKIAIQNDVVQKDYSQFVTLHQPKENKKHNNFFTKDEIDLIYKNINYKCEYPTGKKSYATVELVDTIIILLFTGMRIGELLALQCEDIHLSERYMNVRGTKTKNSDRIIPIHNFIKPLIKARMNKAVNGYLIENANGKPLKYDIYKKNFFDPFMQVLGLHQTPHATRHTFTSMMDSVGISATSVTLKRILGHANSSTTEHYTHKEIKELIQAIDKLNIVTYLSLTD